MAQPQNDQGSRCNFCGEAGHFMRECQVTAEYVCIGKCKRNVENKIVLPSGVTVPQSITSAWLCNCIDEYHHQNPNQLVAAQLLCEVTKPATVLAMVQIEEEPEEAEHKQVCFGPEVGQPGVYTLKKQGSAKGKGKVPQELRIIEIHSDDDSTGEPAKFLRELLPHIPAQLDSNTNGSSQEHPFAVLPLQQRLGDSTVDAAEVLLPSHKAYTTTACIYNEKVVQKVFNQVLNMQVTISQRELLSLAPRIYTKIAEVTVHHWLVRTNVQAVLEGFPEITANEKAE